jgi:hypothetical protein
VGTPNGIDEAALEAEVRLIVEDYARAASSGFEAMGRPARSLAPIEWLIRACLASSG